MAVIMGGFQAGRDTLEEKLRSVDFSKNTNLKAELAKRLFSAGTSSKVMQFTRLSDAETELVNAAQGVIWDPHSKNDEN